MRILLVDNYDSFTYNLLHYLQAYNDVVVDVFRNDKITLNQVEVYDGVVFSPGPGLPHQAGLMPAIIHAFFSTKKMFGVCLGMQALAIKFGYALKNLQQVQHGVARPTLIKADSALFKNMPATFVCGRYHSWVVDEQGMAHSDFKVIATDADNEVMAMQHSQFKIYGVQFHPESIMTPYGKQIIYNWLFEC